MINYSERRVAFKFIVLPFIAILGISALISRNGNQSAATHAKPETTCKTDWTKCTWQDQEAALRNVKALEAAAPIAAPAQSRGDETTATGIATFIVYDSKCQNMPRVFNDMSNEIRRRLPSSIIDAAMDKTLSFYRNAGPATWCTLLKPVVDNAMASFRP